MRFGLGAKFTVTVLLILTGTMAANTLYFVRTATRLQERCLRHWLVSPRQGCYEVVLDRAADRSCVWALGFIRRHSLNLDAARFKALGLDGFAGPLKTTCADHNSHSATFVQQWDGAKWTKVSDLIGPDTAKVEPLIDEAAKAYAEKNAGWPKRTEPCDNK